MHAEGFLHKLLSPVMHQKRLTTLSLFVSTVIRTKRLSLTQLGRESNLPIQERSGIKRADRFLGNSHLQLEKERISEVYIDCLLGAKKRPKIIVDWTHIPNTMNHALRAAMVTDGRALVLYEEVHEEKKLENPTIQSHFLRKLKTLLPPHCQPIILTDAGFYNNWFKEVKDLGWDYIGRIRGTHTYYHQGRWLSCKSLFSSATYTPKGIGEVILCKRNSLNTSLYLVREKIKHRKRVNRYGRTKSRLNERLYQRSRKEPWILASSLTGNGLINAKRIVKLYKLRMQIEESFRDLKSSRYGFGLNQAHSKHPKRIEVLLLIAMLATLLAYVVGYLIERQQLHFRFQANATKKRRVLSLFFLGCRVIKEKDIPVSTSQIKEALIWVQSYAI